MTLAVAIVMMAFLNSMSVLEDDQEEIPNKIGIGLVGDTNDKYLKLGIGAVKTVDATKSYLDIVMYDSEEEALDAMKSSEITGYLNVPEGFIKNVMKGENTPAVFIARNSPVDLAPMLMNDVLSTVSNLVVESQIGIFAMEDYYIENNLKGRNKAVKEMNQKYMGFVLDRDSFAEVVVVESEAPTAQSLAVYFFCGFLVVTLLLIGILAVNSVLKRDLALPRLLSVTGTGAVSQVLCDYAGFFLIFILTIIFVAIVGFGLILGMDFSNVLMFSLGLLPVIFLLSSMQFLVYELTSNVISASLLQFAVSMGFCYISGCFYPITFFPKSLQQLSSQLPIGVAFEYVRGIYSGFVDGPLLRNALIYTFAFLAISILVRNFKIRSRSI